MLFKSFILLAVASVLPVQADYFSQYYYGDCTGTVNDYHTTAGCYNQAGASVLFSFPGCKVNFYSSKGCGGSLLEQLDASALCAEWNGATECYAPLVFDYVKKLSVGIALLQTKQNQHPSFSTFFPTPRDHSDEVRVLGKIKDPGAPDIDTSTKKAAKKITKYYGAKINSLKITGGKLNGERTEFLNDAGQGFSRRFANGGLQTQCAEKQTVFCRAVRACCKVGPEHVIFLNCDRRDFQVNERRKTVYHTLR
ncbi:hypothetical protein K438DRAFT_1759920 [Mycena galopus ATCC 62051]|nr:hypothetical protein K438DRAFT_1759920 [Mycena galopus ATCC 62051]